MKLKTYAQMIVLVSAFAFILPFSVKAEETNKVKVFNTRTTVKSNLEVLINKRVSVKLMSGEEIRGIVKEVGDNLLHLSNLSGKEFYDALVRIDNIAALSTQVRGLR